MDPSAMDVSKDDDEEYVTLTPSDLMEISQIPDEDAQKIIDETDAMCQLSARILGMGLPLLDYEKFAVVDVQNQLHEYRQSHCGNRRGCGRQCYNLRSVVEDISYEHWDKLLFVVQKESNFCGDPTDGWCSLMLELSKLDNVVMCVALSPLLMDVSPVDFDDYTQKRFLNEKKERKKEVEHDDITVLLMKKIIDSELLRDTLLITNDKYRDRNEVIHTTIPFNIHFLHSGKELLRVPINPKEVNGITPCNCKNTSCKYM